MQSLTRNTPINKYAAPVEGAFPQTAPEHQEDSQD